MDFLFEHLFRVSFSHHKKPSFSSHFKKAEDNLLSRLFIKIILIDKLDKWYNEVFFSAYLSD